MRVMAKRKELPKKLCRKTIANALRMYMSTLFWHLRYDKANVKLVAEAETVLGDRFPNENLPRCLCQPCEKKLDNFSKFYKSYIYTYIYWVYQKKGNRTLQ